MAVEVFLQQIVVHLQTFDQLFFPLKLEWELLRHTFKCYLCLFAGIDLTSIPQVIISVTMVYSIDPFPPTTPLAHYLPMLLGVNQRPEIWQLSIIAPHNCYFCIFVHKQTFFAHQADCPYTVATFAFVHKQTNILTRPTGLSMATFGKLPLPSSSLCPAHPPPRSGW